jgi:2-octaprenyl-6-methoxyphenol hydroxylase
MTLALMLSKLRHKVIILDKNSKKKLLEVKDSRTSAISQGSSRILEELSIWNKIKEKAQPINEINVSEGLNTDDLNFKSKSLSEGPLGYIVDNTYLKKTVFKEVLKSNFIKFIGGVNIKDIKRTRHIAKIFSDKGNFSASLIIGADGRNSKMRFFADIKSFFFDYNQVAFVFNISHTLSHQSVALERFFPSGPLAVLPMQNNNKKSSSVVWTVDSAIEPKLLNNKKFNNAFQERYARAFGQITKISRPVKYNLNVISCYEYFKRRIVLIGDACQAIHPIAGQGLNLGLRDSYDLAKVISESLELGLDIGSTYVLRDYSLKRLVDKKLLIQATHRLNQLFSNNFSIIKTIRENGLKIFNKSEYLKKKSMMFAMGLMKFDF